MKCRHTAEPIKPAPPVTSTRIASGAPSIIMKERLNVREPGVCMILIRDHKTAFSYPPVAIHSRIVPRQTPLAIFGVIISRFVNDLAVLFQRDITVCKAWRHPQLLPIGRREFNSHVLAKGRRA